MQKTLRGYLQPFWHNLEKKKVKKKVVVNKSHSIAAIFVSENGMKHFIWSKIHPMNTIEGHSKHMKQEFWYLTNIDKVVFYKTASGGHLVLLMWPKINRLPLLSDLKDYANFKTIIESNMELERPQAKSRHGGHLVFKMAAAPNFFLKARAFAPKMNAKNPKKWAK